MEPEAQQQLGAEPPVPDPARPKTVSLKTWDVDPERVCDSLLGMGKFGSTLPVPERPAEPKNA